MKYLVLILLLLASINSANASEKVKQSRHLLEEEYNKENLFNTWNAKDKSAEVKEIKMDDGEEIVVIDETFITKRRKKPKSQSKKDKSKFIVIPFKNKGSKPKRTFLLKTK